MNAHGQEVAEKTFRRHGRREKRACPLTRLAPLLRGVPMFNLQSGTHPFAQRDGRPCPRCPLALHPSGPWLSSAATQRRRGWRVMAICALRRLFGGSGWPYGAGGCPVRSSDGSRDDFPKPAFSQPDRGQSALRRRGPSARVRLRLAMGCRRFRCARLNRARLCRLAFFHLLPRILLAIFSRPFSWDALFRGFQFSGTWGASCAPPSPPALGRQPRPKGSTILPHCCAALHTRPQAISTGREKMPLPPRIGDSRYCPCLRVCGPNLRPK